MKNFKADRCVFMFLKLTVFCADTMLFFKITLLEIGKIDFE